MAKFYHQRGEFNPDDCIAPFISYSSKMLKERANQIITLDKFYKDQGKDINDQTHMDCISGILIKRRREWFYIEKVVKNITPSTPTKETNKLLNLWKNLTKRK
jgi:hypothetical protein